MTRIKRSIKQPDGTVTTKHRRGPYLTESLTDKLRPIVIELHPTHLVLRSHGCRGDKQALSYTQLHLWAAKAAAEAARREKARDRDERKKQKQQLNARRRSESAAGRSSRSPRRTVRRGSLIHAAGAFSGSA